MLFNFELYPVDEVSPWGDADNKYLSWFGLTEGYYWLRLGDVELFRYTDAAQEYWRSVSPDFCPTMPYADYHVVRLWEDTLCELDSILEPVPSDIADLVGSRAMWQTWESTILNALEEAEGLWEVYALAHSWWWSRSIDSGHLTDGPRLWVWRDADVQHIWWDANGIVADDTSIRRWTADSGEISMATTLFVEEVKSFNSRLIRAMAERIGEIRTHWSRPEIHESMSKR